MAAEVTPGTDGLHPLVRARITYLNDGEPASGATVNVEAVAPDGDAMPPTQLADVGGGAYEAALTLPAPGAWTFRLTATTPAATAEATYTATAPTTTSDEPAERSTSATGIADREEAGGSGEDSGGSGTAAAVIVIALALAIAALGTAIIVRRRVGNTSLN